MRSIAYQWAPVMFTVISNFSLKTKFGLTIGISLIVSLLITYALNSTGFQDSVRQRMLDVESPRTMGEIQSAIGNIISVPITVGIETANNPTLLDWVAQGEPESGLDHTKRLLASVKDRHGAQASFISNRTFHYYNEQGVFKTLSRENEHDVWFYRFIDSKAVHVVETDFDEVTRKLTLFINIRVGEADNPGGVVGIGFKATRVAQLIDEFRVGETGYVFLVNKSGKVEIHPPRVVPVGPTLEKYFGDPALAHQMLSGERVVAREVTLPIGKSLVSSAQVPQTDWTMVIVVPEKELFADIEKRLRFGLAITLAIGIVFVLVGVLMARLINRGVEGVVVSLKELAAGKADLTKRLKAGSEDEIGQLVRSFNTFADKLQGDYATLEEANQSIMESIHYASTIQRSLLRPSNEELNTQFKDFFMEWQPRDVVGGDFYYCRQFEKGTFVAMFDCTGHGVPGAFMTLIMASALHHLVREDSCDRPAEVMGEMNRFVKVALDQVEETNTFSSKANAHDYGSDDGMDGAFLFFPKAGGRLLYAGARTPLFLLPPNSEQVEVTRGNPKGVGYAASPMNYAWQEHTFDLPTGMLMFITTDGLTDQVGGPKKIQYGKDRMVKLLVHNRHQPTSIIRTRLLEELAAWQGSEARRDDVTIFALRTL